MEPRSFICLNCQNPLRLDSTQRRPDSSEGEKKTENEITESLSGHSKNLMKLISDAQFPSDAPVCKDCSDALLSDMDGQLASLEEECVSYKKYIDYLKNNHPSSSIPELKAQLQNLQDEERDLEIELKKLMKEEEEIDAQLQQKKKQAETTTETSAKLWKKYRDNLRKILDDQEESNALDAERQYAEVQLRKLMDTNVLDLCFHIWVEGRIGEINGFRLGYLRETPVEWTEINAAFGHVVLLIEILLERLNIRHRDLIPVAMGSHSYIKRRQNGMDETFQLYGQGTPFNGSSQIDRGVPKFLELMDFLQKELKDRNSNFKPPYSIKVDGFVDNGVKYSALMLLNIDSRWTRAMSMMLINLKAATAQIESLRQPA